MPDSWHGSASPLLHAAVWVFAVIVLGITAWFKSMTDSDGGRHLVYQLVVAVLTVAIWPVVLFFSLRDVFGLRRHLPLVTLSFSFLWLASTVVSIDDWAEETCNWTWPWGRCAYKHTVIAFNFLAFFFIVLALITESFFIPTSTHRTRHTTTRV